MIGLLPGGQISEKKSLTLREGLEPHPEIRISRRLLFTWVYNKSPKIPPEHPSNHNQLLINYPA